MMLHIILITMCCYTARSQYSVYQRLEDFEYSDGYVYVSDDANIMRKVYRTESVDINFIRKVMDEPGTIYSLFTRENPHDAETLFYEDETSVTISNFDATKATVFIIHGWLGNRFSVINTVLTEAFLQDGDVNVIVVDWCATACHYSYLTVTNSVPAVGRDIGKFVMWLTTLGASFDKIHVIGHSLGAHVAGNAGRETGAKVQRITGLDPAGPFWGSSSHRLVKSDAQYVEVIHTNTKCLGFTDVCGHADFYPNGGRSMPNCILSTCSHSKAYYYMAESVKNNNMYALPCQTLEDVASDVCEGEPYLMGNSDLYKNRSGIFRLNIETETCNTDESREEPELESESIPTRRFINLRTGLYCIY